MASFDYGLNLHLQNSDIFIKQAEKVDAVFANLANTVQGAADKLKNISFGNLKIDLSGISAIRTDTITNKAAAIEKMANAYKNLGAESKNVNTQTLSDINKAFSGGAKAETISAKAKALGTMVGKLKALSQLPDLSTIASQITAMMNAFSAAKLDTSTFGSFATVAKDITGLVNAFKKIGTFQIDKTTIESLQSLSVALFSLASPSMQMVIPFIGEVSKKLKVLFSAIRTLATGQEAALLPAILKQVTETISTLIKELSALNKPFGGGKRIIQEINDISTAFRNLGIAIRSYGDATSGNLFANIDKNVRATLNAFNILITAFRNQKFSDDINKTIKPATEGIVALGQAFETLGRRKGFVEFPKTIEQINQAITTLNVKALEELSARISNAVPVLKQLADVAKAVSIINTEAGRTFAKLAADKMRDAEANNALVRSYNILRGAVVGIGTVISGLVTGIARVSQTFAGLIVPATQLGQALLRLPFNFVAAGFRLLVNVITAPFDLLRAIGVHVLKFAHDLHLMQIGLQAIIAPFKLLHALLSTTVTIVGGAATAFGRLTNVFTSFGGSNDAVNRTLGNIDKSAQATATSATNLGTAFDNSSKKVAQGATNIDSASRSVKQSGDTMDASSGKAERYGQSLSRTGDSANKATSGLSNFTSGLHSTSSGVEGAIERLGRLQITIASVQKFMSTAEHGLTLIGERLFHAGESAFEAAAKFEQLQISLSILSGREAFNANPGQFDTVMQAAESVKAEVNEVIERFELLAIQSPFTSEDIAAGYQLAQVYGFTGDEAETLTKILVDANAAIGGAGYNIAGIVLPLGQIRQLGKATLVDLKQVATAAKLPIFEELAKSFSELEGRSVTVTEVMDRISEGMVSADFAINTVVNSLKRDFTGAAAASGNSMAGIASTIADFRENALRKYATPIIQTILFGRNEGDFGIASLFTMERIQQKLEEASAAGEKLAITVNRVFQTIVTLGRYAQAVLDAIPQPIKDIAANMALLVGVAFAVNLGFGILASAAFETVIVLGLFINTNTILIGAIIGLGTVAVKNYDAIKAAVINLRESFSQVPQFVSALGSAFTSLFTKGENTKDSFAGLNVILQNFGNFLVSGVATIGRFGTAFSKAFGQLLTTGKASVEVFSGFPAIFQVVGTEIFKVMNTFASWGNSIANFPATLGGVATTVGSIFQGILTEFVEWGGNIVGAFADGINGTINLLGQAIQAIGSVLTFWLAPGSPPRVAPELDTWGSLAALEYVQAFAGAFVDAMNGAVTFISQNFTSMASGIGNGLLNIFAGIGKFVGVFFVSSLANAVAGIITVLNSVFYIIASVAQGVGNQVGIIIVTIIRIVESLQKPMTAFEQFRSIVQIVAEAIKASIENLGNTLSGVFSGILGIIGAIVAFINGQYLAAFVAMSTVSVRVAESLDEIAAGSRDFLGGVQDALQGAESFFISTMDNVTTYGGNIVQMFADGMLDTVSAVADALSAIGEMITYWLEPGSPPRLLPDIDKWGTEAANQFLGGFTKSDFDTIGQFGDTVEQLFKSMDISGFNTEEIVQEFAQGLANEDSTGDFGSAQFARISELAGEAGPEVASLAQKYAEVAREQAALNDVTNKYNKELESVQGTLDDINRTEGIEANQAKVKSLTNALSNSLLTQTERTRIQKQIEKLQAETRLKQLEAEKNAQEKNVGSAQEAIDLQKEQLQLAEKFDGSSSGLTGASGEQSNLSSTADKAAKAQERLSAALLKQKLEATDTAGKIAILKEELAKMEVGSLEYVQTQTQILKLEQQLEREREAAAKKATSANAKALSEAERIHAAERDLALAKADTAGQIEIWREELSKTAVGSEEYYQILKKIELLQQKLAKEQGPGGSSGGLTSLQGAQESVQQTIQKTQENLGNLQKRVQEQFTSIGNTIRGAVDTIRGYLDTWILKNDNVKASLVAIGIVLGGAKIIGGISSLASTLALLSNPVTAIGAGIVAVGAAFGFFAVKAGGVQNLIDGLREKFTLLMSSFGAGATSGEMVDLDFSSITSTIQTLSNNIGAGTSNIGTILSTLFTNIGLGIQAGITTIGDYIVAGFNNLGFYVNLALTNLGIFFSGAWDGFQNSLILVLSNLNVMNTALGQIVGYIVSSFFTFLINPMVEAFSSSDTLLGGLTAAMGAFYNGVILLVNDVSTKIQSFLASSNNGEKIEQFFTETFLGRELEANINEAIGNIVPSLEGSFDLSTFIIDVVNQFKSLYSSILEVAGTIGTALEPIITAFANFRAALSGEGTGVIANVIRETKAAFTEFTTEVVSPEFIAGLTNIGKLLGILAGAIAAVAAAITTAALVAILKNFSDIIIEVGAGIGTLFEAFSLFMAGDILGGLGKAFQGLGQIWDGVFGNLADILDDTVKTLLGFLNIDTTGTLGTVIDIVADLVVQFFAFGGIMRVVRSGWGLLVTAFNYGKTALTALIGLFTASSTNAGILSKILNGLKSVVNLIVKNFSTLATTLASVVKSLYDNGLTIGGVFISIKNRIAEAFSNLGTTIREKLSTIPSTIAGWFSEWVSGNPLGLQALALAINFVSSLATSLTAGIPGLGTSIKTSFGLIDLTWVASFFSGIFNFETPEIVEQLKTKIGTVVNDAIAGIEEVAFNVADALIISEEEKTKLAEKIEGFLPNFDSIFGEGSTEKTALALSDFITFDEAEFQTVKELFQGIIDTLGKFATLVGIPEAFTTSLTAIKDLVAGESTFGQALNTVATALGTVVTNLNTAVGNPFSLISDTISGLTTPITTVSEGLTTLKDAITGLLEIDLSGFTQVFAPITDTFASIQSKIDGLKEGIGVLNLIPGVNIGDAEVTGGDAVQEKIKAAVGNQTLTLDQKLEVITDDENLATQSKKLLDAFLASYEENTTLGVTDFGAINSDLIEQGFTAADITTLATKFGKEVPAGLAEGLTDTSGELDRATRGLATNLLSDIATDLGIQSPSTKARDDIGIPFVQGIAAGLEDYSVVTEALTRVATAMFQTTADILNANAATINIAQALFTLNEDSVAITNEALTNILDFHTETFDEIQDEVIPNFIGSVEEQFEEVYENLLYLAEDFKDDFLYVLDELQRDTLSFFTGFLKKLTDLGNQFKNAGKDLGEALMEGMKEAIEDQTASVIGAINNVFGAEGAGSNTLIQKATDAGKKIGQAFTEGVAEGILAPLALVAIRDAVVEMINEAQQAAEQAAGIQSPSTLFRDRIGVNLTAGIGEGMIDGVGSLIETTRAVLATVYAVARDNIGAEFTQGITDGINSRQVVLNNSIADMLNNSVIAAKNTLQIRSPSKVTKMGIGMPYVDGIMAGLESGRTQLSNVAGSLLDVLPSGKTFTYDISGHVAKQPVEMQYSNLLTALPALQQTVSMIRHGNLAVPGNLGYSARVIGSPYDAMRNATMQQVSNMHDARQTTVSHNVVNNYQMSVVTTPDRAERVAHNFEAMRLKRRV